MQSATHNALASEQGYQDLAATFPYNDAYIKKEDPHIAFFVDTVEPVCAAYEAKRYGEMFTAVGEKTGGIRAYGDKLQWTADLDKLLGIRQNESIGAVIDHVLRTQHPTTPDAVDLRERALKLLGPNPTFEENSPLETLYNLKRVPYRQVMALDKFLDEKTPFSTKHGVKGDEFENVLVVLGRGWNLYNFSQFLEWAAGKCPPDKQETYERNRNLFYVACSRPKKRLALLFTQKISANALATLEEWFGKSAVHPALKA